MSAKLTSRKSLSLTIVLLVAGLHLLEIGRYLNESGYILYTSYFSDLVLPFALYFLLCVAEENWPWLRRWWVKAGLVLGAAWAAEGLQFLGIYALGITFDPLDLVMYLLGVLLAVALERSFLYPPG